MKVLFTNDYAMDAGWRQWEAGAYPAHHLWGTTALGAYGMEVDILPFERYRRVKRLTVRTVGDVDQQVRILTRRTGFDVVYSATQYNTMLLSMLRSLRLFRRPIVAIVHHPVRGVLRRPRVFRALFGGHDRLLCLSDRVERQLRDEVGVPPAVLERVDWGFDLPFYDEALEEGRRTPPGYFISAGKTKRDFDTLVRAFASVDYPLRLYCSAESAPSVALPPNVTVRYRAAQRRQAKALSERELAREYAGAFAVAVPLQPVDESTGLTSLLEAMVMAKAVIMTRNPGISIDIEGEGIGLWVEPRDPESWRAAVERLLAEPEETKAMGARGRALCERRFNLEGFTHRVATVLSDVHRLASAGEGRGRWPR